MIAVTYIDHMGSDLSTVNAARVSFGKKSDWDYVQLEMFLKPSDERLIRYLAKHEHISPFGHAFASFHVKAPIFVARQLVKHKFLRWNEISRRYVSDEPEFYQPDVWRSSTPDKKQGSGGPVDSGAKKAIMNKAEQLTKGSARTYRRMIELGLCEEQARAYLPQGMMTEWYWSGSLDAFASMCKLRLKEDTQYESRLVAQQISDKMSELFPLSWEALIGGQT